jgi:hypothetical protein
MAAKDTPTRRVSETSAPDPATSYERAKPEKEAGMGRLDNNPGTPTDSPDQIEDAVKHKQALRQINADDVVDAREEGQADGSRTRADQPRPTGAHIREE